jgi:glucan phosphorylase
MTDATGPPGTVQDKAQEAVGQAQEKAKEATSQAQGMVREQVDQRSTQAGEKVSQTAEDMRSVGEELRKQDKEGPAKLADRAAQRTEQLGSYLSEADSDRLLGDIEELGRRQPLAVLAGGLVVGIAAARFLKASSRSRYRGRTGAAQPTRELSTPPPPPAIPAQPAATQAPVHPEPAPTGSAVGR